jgi:hypothetical protein
MIKRTGQLRTSCTACQSKWYATPASTGAGAINWADPYRRPRATRLRTTVSTTDTMMLVAIGT